MGQERSGSVDDERESAVTRYGPGVDDVERLAELMGRPGPIVPLDEACLLIARAVRPDLVAADVAGRLDELAATCPAPILDVMLEHLFGQGRLSGNRTDYQDPANSLLDQVLTRGLGLPITLCIVAIEVGRRIGVPVQGVGMPGHFLLRDKVDPTVFADPFDNGRVLDASACRQLFQRSTGASATWDDRFLEPTHDQAIIARVLRNLLPAYAKRGELAGLRRLVALRLACPGLHPSEASELARVLAPLN
jgi:regulator of sirC expression with transglutaminase-like and TPR domain